MIPTIHFSEIGGGVLILSTDKNQYYFNPKGGEKEYLSLCSILHIEAQRRSVEEHQERKVAVDPKMLEDFLSNGGLITKANNNTTLEDLGL